MGIKLSDIKHVGRYELKEYAAKGDYKYILQDIGWNDYGYYTLHGLYKIQGGKAYKVCSVYFFNESQEFNRHAKLGTLDFHTFITSEESALLLKCTHDIEEIRTLVKVLNIEFRVDNVEDLPMFEKSLLRNHTKEEFIERQRRIRKIIYSPIDFQEILSDNQETIEDLVFF